MIDTRQFVDGLLLRGIEKIAGVPCSFLTPLINEAENRGIYEPFVNEGDAMAYAAGSCLAGHRCAVVMQNSGLSNALSPLTSLNELFGLGTLLIIGNRGRDDEPQHRIMAGCAESFLDAVGIKHIMAEEEGAVDRAFKQLSEKSCALLVNARTTFSPVPLKRSREGDDAFPLRYDMLKEVFKAAGRSVVATTTGFTSREMFCAGDRPENFYMVGSMGCLSSLALGLAENVKDRTVIAVDGDSACLMRLGGLYTLTQKKPDHLFYLVLDNESNESTGGQRNSLGDSRLFDVMESLYPTQRVDSPEELFETIQAFQKNPVYTQVYARIRTGSIKNLPRPDRQLIFNQARRFQGAVL